MKPIALPALLALVMGPVTLAPAEEPKEDPAARALLRAHNVERADRKLPPLEADAMLSRAAKEHAKDLAEHGRLSHEGSDGSAPADRAARVGYRGVRVGENVAEGQADAAAAMKSWMESEGHRRNILGDYTQMGAARARGEDGRPYWCVVFGLPRPKLDPDKAEAEVLERLDAARKEAGKGPLKPSPKLSRAARAAAAALAGTSKEPGGAKAPDLGKLLGEAGVKFRNVVACTGAGSPRPEDFVKTILADESQKESILSALGSVGIGYARDADENPFWCILMVEE